MPHPVRATAAAASTRVRTGRGRRVAASTARTCRSRPPAFVRSPEIQRASGSFRRVNPFWFVGGACAVWAIVLTFVFGLRREDFPRNDGQMRAVMMISIVLVAGAIGSAIYGGVSGAGENTGFRHSPEAGHSK